MELVNISESNKFIKTSRENITSSLQILDLIINTIIYFNKLVFIYIAKN